MKVSASFMGGMRSVCRPLTAAQKICCLKAAGAASAAAACGAFSASSTPSLSTKRSSFWKPPSSGSASGRQIKKGSRPE